MSIFTKNQMNIFTIYWKDGSKNIISGLEINDAFTMAGFSAGAIHAVDWYDNGVTSTHFYDKLNNKWIKREVTIVNKNIFFIDNDDIQLMVELAKTLGCVLDNGDKITINKNWHKYNDGTWYETIKVKYAERIADDVEYSDTGIKYFNINDTHKAIEFFIKTVMHGDIVTIENDGSVGLNTIIEEAKKLSFNQ